MDLSFVRFEQETRAAIAPADLAMLMVGVAARQAASPTAVAQAGIERRATAAAAFAPAHGAFSRPVAELLAGTSLTPRQDR